MLIVPEINRSTNRSIFNKLSGEGERNIQRLIKHVNVFFKEVVVEGSHVNKKAGTRPVWVGGRASRGGGKKKGGETEVSKLPKYIKAQDQKNAFNILRRKLVRTWEL